MQMCTVDNVNNKQLYLSLKLTLPTTVSLIPFRVTIADDFNEAN